MGSEYFYGFVGSDTSQWEPNLFRNTTTIYPYVGKPGWNLTTAMADDAIEWLNQINQIDPSKPLLLLLRSRWYPRTASSDTGMGQEDQQLHLFDKGWNALREGPEALSPGKHIVEFDFKYEGLGPETLAFNNLSGIGQPGTGVLKVDGKEVATRKMDHTIPLIMQWDETFDIGSDTGTPVDDQDYQVPFKFTGKLSRRTIKIDRPQLTPKDEKRLMEAERNNKTSE
jgi:hypothetical protein